MSLLDPAAARRLVIDTVAAADFRRASFAGPQRGQASPWIRVVIRPVEIRGDRNLQISYFDERKDISKNVAPSQIAGPLAEILDVGFAGIHLTTADEEIDLRTTPGADPAYLTAAIENHIRDAYRAAKSA